MKQNKDPHSITMFEAHELVQVQKLLFDLATNEIFCKDFQIRHTSSPILRFTLLSNKPLEKITHAHWRDT